MFRVASVALLVGLASTASAQVFYVGCGKAVSEDYCNGCMSVLGECDCVAGKCENQEFLCHFEPRAFQAASHGYEVYKVFTRCGRMKKCNNSNGIGGGECPNDECYDTDEYYDSGDNSITYVVGSPC